MNKVKTILIIAIWVAILPYLGFPYFIKNTLFTLSGLAILSLGYLTFKTLGAEKEKDVFDNFTESETQ